MIRKLLKFSNTLLEQGLLPDPIIRMGIRGLLKEKLDEESQLHKLHGSRQKADLIELLNDSPIAVNTCEANEQHYELPTEFFKLVLGKHMKYSCGWWNEGVKDLDESEKDMLELYTQRAQLDNGQNILELGCGWGSLSLFMAEKYPHSQIVGVSNSATQKEYILNEAKNRKLHNLRIITADMNDFTINEQFDRVVSIEMFEHMRNYTKLFKKIAGFMNEDARLFVHIFAHKDYAYLYQEQDEHDWIAKYFFTGGIMPSADLFTRFNEHLEIEEQWRVNGTHYQKTSEAWLRNMDRNKSEIIPILKHTYGPEQYKKWWVYWRVFFMSCAELWGYDHGNEWIVCHYRFKKKD